MQITATKAFQGDSHGHSLILQEPITLPFSHTQDSKTTLFQVGEYCLQHTIQQLSLVTVMENVWPSKRNFGWNWLPTDAVFNPCWYACYMIKVEAHIRGKTKPFDTQKVNKVNHCNIFNKNWSQKLRLPILLDEKTSQ